MEYASVAPIRLTKIEAAERQLNAAIDIFFSDGDLVPAWTLAAAAYNVIKNLKEHQGSRDMMLKHQMAAALDANLNRYENFLKHADRDPNEVLEFNPRGQIELLLLDASLGFHSLTERMSPQMLLAQMWFFGTTFISHNGGAEFQKWADFVRRRPDEPPSSYRGRFREYVKEGLVVDRKSPWFNLSLAVYEMQKK